MLSAAQRLRRSIEFAAAVRGGRRAGRGAVVVHLTLPDAEEHGSSKPAPAGSEAQQLPSRAGFVVSKAVGNAVVRNSVRRRLRHLIRERLTELPTGATVVVRALPAAADLPYARLAADLDAALAAARSARRPSRRPR
jgi:ribonuclease P protein component